MKSSIEVIGKRILEASDYELTSSEIDTIIEAKGSELDTLFYFANQIKEKYIGDKVYTCSIINAKSGVCPEDCAFCSQSAHHSTNSPVYDLRSKEHLVEEGLKNNDIGATQYSFVASGTRMTEKDINTVCEATKELKEKTKLSICSSIGMLDEDRAKTLVAAGVERYHHNLETSRSFFPEICSTHDYDEDIETVMVAKKAGLKVCSGFIAGLGESFHQRVEVMQTLKEMDVDSIPINFINPVKGTKLENNDLVSPMDALKTIALCRFINPTSSIGICGGREVTLGDFQSWIFRAGANGFMIGNYLTTTGRDYKADLKMLEELGLKNETK